MNRIDQETENAVRRFLALIAPKYDMAGVIVYGSRVRGTHRPDSDADVAVILRGEHQRALAVTLAMADMAFDVLLDTGINISPLPVWLDEWEHPENYSNPALLKNIVEEGVRLNLPRRHLCYDGVFPLYGAAPSAPTHNAYGVAPWCHCKNNS